MTSCRMIPSAGLGIGIDRPVKPLWIASKFPESLVYGWIEDVDPSRGVAGDPGVVGGLIGAILPHNEPDVLETRLDEPDVKPDGLVFTISCTPIFGFIWKLPAVI